MSLELVLTVDKETRQLIAAGQALRARCNTMMVCYAERHSWPLNASPDEYKAYRQWRNAWITYIKEVRDGHRAL